MSNNEPPQPRDVGPKAGEGASAGLKRATRRSRRWLLAFAAAALLLAPLAFLAGGFLWFVAHVPAEEPQIERHADAIVVLTGGSSRIADAVDLLAMGKGGRLLISGVHPSTSAREIAQLVPAHRRWFDCCVDLDYSAVNTLGNAVEARRWAKGRGFRSLIVVTSSYHMPRAMIELGRHLPDIALIAFPVVSDRMRAEPWWRSLYTARLLASEYLKYLYAFTRMQLGSDHDSADRKMGPSHAPA